MKITRLAGLLATGILLATTAACGGSSGGSSPEAAAKKALEALVDEDLRAMCEITLEDGEPRPDEDLDECVSDAEEAQAESEKFLEEADEETRKQVTEETDKMKDALRDAIDAGPTDVGDEKDGEVVVTYEVDGDDAPVTVKKIDGNWYLDTLAG